MAQVCQCPVLLEAKGNQGSPRFRVNGRFGSTMTDHAFEIEELGTERYSSLEDAQRAALPHLADLVASIVRQGIEDGRFVVVDGVVRLAERYYSQGMADRGFTNGENVV